MKVTVLVGNPSPNSRTRLLAEAVGAAISRVLENEAVTLTRATIDLADHAGAIFDLSEAKLIALNNQVASSDLIVVASPTYKAAYTGLLTSQLPEVEAIVAAWLSVSQRPLLGALRSSQPR